MGFWDTLLGGKSFSFEDPELGRVHGGVNFEALGDVTQIGFLTMSWPGGKYESNFTMLRGGAVGFHTDAESEAVTRAAQNGVLDGARQKGLLDS